MRCIFSSNVKCPGINNCKTGQISEKCESFRPEKGVKEKTLYLWITYGKGDDAYKGFWICEMIQHNRYFLFRKKEPENVIFLDFEEDGAWITDYTTEEVHFKVDVRPATIEEKVLEQLA